MWATGPPKAWLASQYTRSDRMLKAPTPGCKSGKSGLTQKLQNHLNSRSNLIAPCNNPCELERSSLIFCCNQDKSFCIIWG